MSDVYVAFVRDDQPFAEALAVAMQGSGFTVSRSSSVVDAIGECAAIVVLWTPAAARSKLFVDAADRAFRSGKMVLARMGSDPLPPMFAGTEAHALSRWTGDPESQDIDSIVFHVDRLVSRARLASGGRAVPEQPEAAPPPRGVVHRFPSGGGAAAARARPAEQPQPTMAHAAAPADSLAEEASYWRQIQHSNNPGDFYAYLERFGREGTFAELAEARISALGPRSAPAPHQPSAYQPQQPPSMQHAPQHAPQYQPQYQPQPQPQQPPPRQPPHQQPYQQPGPGPGPVARGGFNMQPPPAARPAPRPAPQPAPRLDPHPARARVEAPPSAAPRDTGGGGMRGIVFLIFLAVVGGGGFYVYQQFRGPAPDSETAVSTEDWLPPTTSSNPADDGQPTDAVGDPNPIPAETTSAAPRREPAPRQQQAASAASVVEDGPTPQPTLRTIPSTASAPPPERYPATVGDPEAASAFLREVAPPPVATTAPVATPAFAAPAARPPSRPRWAQRATGRDLTAAYPAAAARRNVEGRVVLDCLIGADLAIRCRATSETPGGYGFAAAALRVAQKYRAQPTMEDGRPSAGERTTIAINFRPAP
jgi:outer membrane biosynthesis protein TonB